MWDGVATPDVLGALEDEHWRVRETARRVVQRHLLGSASPAVAGLRAGPVERVRDRAVRVYAALAAAGS